MLNKIAGFYRIGRNWLDFGIIFQNQISRLGGHLRPFSPAFGKSYDGHRKRQNNADPRLRRALFDPGGDIRFVGVDCSEKMSGEIPRRAEGLAIGRHRRLGNISAWGLGKEGMNLHFCLILSGTDLQSATTKLLEIYRRPAT